MLQLFIFIGCFLIPSIIGIENYECKNVFSVFYTNCYSLVNFLVIYYENLKGLYLMLR